jgi:hypothetical protein
MARRAAGASSTRFGSAYQIDAKTVTRGGYGILYDRSAMGVAYATAGLAGFRADTNTITSLDERIPLNYLRNPFPYGYLEPLGAQAGPTSGLNTLLGHAITEGWFPDNANPIIQQWNFNLQREAPWHLVVEAGCLANKGNHLADGGSSPYNQLTANFLTLRDSLNDLVDNPFYVVIEDATLTLSQPWDQRHQLLRPFPQYTSLTPSQMTNGNSIYHAFTLRVEKRMSAGLAFLLAFTGGKIISDSERCGCFNEGGTCTRQDVYNQAADRAVSAQDVASRLVLGGWQINGLMTLQSGLAIEIRQSFNNLGLGSGAQRPTNNCATAERQGGTKDERLRQWFDTSVFSITRHTRSEYWRTACGLSSELRRSTRSIRRSSAGPIHHRRGSRCHHQRRGRFAEGAPTRPEADLLSAGSCVAHMFTRVISGGDQ